MRDSRYPSHAKWTSSGARWGSFEPMRSTGDVPLSRCFSLSSPPLLPPIPKKPIGRIDPTMPRKCPRDSPQGRAGNSGAAGAPPSLSTGQHKDGIPGMSRQGLYPIPPVRTIWECMGLSALKNPTKQAPQSVRNSASKIVRRYISISTATAALCPLNRWLALLRPCRISGS
jgi:hypothetical protein